MWISTTDSSAALHLRRILPDGCVDLVWFDNERIVVSGPATRPLLTVLPAHATVVGARLRSGMARTMLGVPADELRDLHVPLGDIWGADLVERAVDRCQVFDSPDARLTTLHDMLVTRLAWAAPPDELVMALIDRLHIEPVTRIGALAGDFGVSERHLLRRFLCAVGYGPKTLQRILRVQRVLAWAGETPLDGLDLARLAIRAGYADQAHMTREFSEIAGSPPARLLRGGELPAMSDSFKTPVSLTC